MEQLHGAIRESVIAAFKKGADENLKRLVSQFTQHAFDPHTLQGYQSAMTVHVQSQLQHRLRDHCESVIHALVNEAHGSVLQCVTSMMPSVSHPQLHIHTYT